MEPLDLDTESTPPAGREESARRTVHLSTLMLVIAIIAVGLGVFRQAPRLGILLTILVIPAVARTIFGVKPRPVLDPSMSWKEKIFAFLGALVIALVIFLAASIAFVAICLSTVVIGRAPQTLDLGLQLGLAAAGAILCIGVFIGNRLLRRWSWKGPHGTPGR
jgi:hypothetical protein